MSAPNAETGASTTQSAMAAMATEAPTSGLSSETESETELE